MKSLRIQIEINKDIRTVEVMIIVVLDNRNKRMAVVIRNKRLRTICSIIESRNNSRLVKGKEIRVRVKVRIEVY